MGLSSDLVKRLSGWFEPSTTTRFRYRGKDVVVQCDEKGNAIRAFIGKANEEGIVIGDRYSRILKKDGDGTLIKDHWERKGKAS